MPPSKTLAFKPVLFLTLAVVIACGDDEGITGVHAPGAPARIVLASWGAAGGQVYGDTLTVDSATARYQVIDCTTTGFGTCVTTTGDVQLAVLDLLFEAAQARAFRKLRASYSRPADYTPPDPWGAALTVTVGERTRTIRWDRDAIKPQALVEFQCLLLAARGALILCD